MENNMKYCKICGSPYTAGTKFCAVCGEILNTSDAIPEQKPCAPQETPQVAQQVAPQPLQQQAQQVAPQPVQQQAPQVAPQPVPQQAPQVAPQPVPQPMATPVPAPAPAPAPKSKKGVLVAVIAVVVLVAVVALATIGYFAEQVAQNRIAEDAASEEIVENNNGEETGTNGKVDGGVGYDGEESDDTTGFSLGTVEDGTYENEYMGIKCVLTYWDFADREELLELTDIAFDVAEETFDNEELTELLSETDGFCDMYATLPDGRNINVMIESNNVISYESYDEETLMKAVAEQVASYHSDAGMPLKSYRTFSKNINGTEKWIFYYVRDISGIEAHFYQIMQTNSTHIATISFVGYSEQQLNDVCGQLYFE